MRRNRVKEKQITATDLFKPEEIKPLSYPLQHKWLIVNPMVHTPEYRTRKSLVWLAQGGFGCEEHARGTGVFALCCGDGEQAKLSRGDFVAEFVGDINALKAEA